MALIISPEVKLRQDEGRVILFSVNPGDSLAEEAFAFLYPQQAIILSLFNGERDAAEIIRLIGYLFNLDTKSAAQVLEDLLARSVSGGQTIGSLLVEISSFRSAPLRVYDPKDFIIPAEVIDMSDVRCKIPCSLNILPTMRCITNCLYCYADRSCCHTLAELSLPLFKRILKEANECGIETIQISGGDIFCRDDVFDLIESTLSEDMYINIPTKYPLSKEQVELLAKIGLSTIQISIDAVNPDLIDFMVGGMPGYGERILKTLEHLGEVGISVRTNTVLTPNNIHDATNLASHLARMPHVFKSNFTCYSRSLYQHDDALFCSEADVSKFETELNRIKVDFPHKHIFFNGFLGDPLLQTETERADNFLNRAFCTANRRGVIVLPDGRVTICEELYFHKDFIIGNLNNQSLMDVWNSPEAMKIVHPDKDMVPDGHCKECDDFRSCHEGLGRCFRDVLKVYGYDKAYCPDPRCPRAPLGNRMA